MEWLETLPVHLKPKRISILPQGSKPERWKRWKSVRVKNCKLALTILTVKLYN